jgi:hypothetical protein
MNRKHDGTIHDEAMRRLRFVCAEIVSDENYFEVEKYLPLISRVLKCPSLIPMPGLAPDHFCHKCMKKMKHFDEGRTLTTSLVMRECSGCGPGCSSCLIRTKRTQGRGRKK